MDSTAAEPIARFEAWMAEATKSEPNDPNAVCLATCTPEGRPSARMVLLKGVDPKGFVFYTNLESRKGGELLGNPFAALCFHWKTLQRSVRVEGRSSASPTPRRMPTTPPAPGARASAPGPAGSRARWKAASRWRRRWPNTP